MVPFDKQAWEFSSFLKRQNQDSKTNVTIQLMREPVRSFTSSNENLNKRHIYKQSGVDVNR